MGSGRVLRAEWAQMAVVVALSVICFAAVVTFYDNSHRGTTNGLWKSIDVEPWVSVASARQTQPANLVYFPMVGSMVRLLPAELGPVWKRMVWVNVLFAALALAFTYLAALRLFQARAPAVFVVAVQAACGFFLLLATINEDIMPAYACLTAAVAWAVLMARRQTAVSLLVMAQLAALTWLFHSSLQLPTVGALLASIVVGDAPLRVRARRALWFMAGLLPLPVLAARMGGLSWTDGLWTSKGLDSGYSGFAANKIVLMWHAMAQFVAGGQNEPSLDVHPGTHKRSADDCHLGRAYPRRSDLDQGVPAAHSSS